MLEFPPHSSSHIHYHFSMHSFAILEGKLQVLILLMTPTHQLHKSIRKKESSVNNSSQ